MYDFEADDNIILEFPQKPMGSDSPDQCCYCCGVAAAAIDGRLEGHKEWCSWRRWVEAKQRAIRAEGLAVRETQEKSEFHQRLLEAEGRNEELVEANRVLEGVLADLAVIAGVPKGDVVALLTWAGEMSKKK